MKIDFWQVSEGPVARVVAQIAPKVLASGERMLVVDADPDRRAEISQALWAGEGFLANGETHPSRQPVLLAGDCLNNNGATVAVLADGKWRNEAEGYARTIVLFGTEGIVEARALYSRFGGRDDVTRSYFAQEGGKWVKRV